MFKFSYFTTGVILGVCLALVVVYSYAWFLENYILLAMCQAH